MIKPILAILLLMVFSSIAYANFTAEQSPDGLVITPSIDYTSAKATIDGPLGLQQLSFERGQAIVLPLPGLDGQYQYELVLTPVLTLAQVRNRDAARDAGSNASTIDSSLTVTSGSFAVLGSDFVTSSAEADNDTSISGPNPDPNVVLTTVDGVIQGSLCAGFDCPAAPAFGFDTFRMQENNLRIHFDDTSAGATFPGNDWRLIANDSGNGGANLFALEDSTAGRRIAVFEAGAPVNSLYLEADGDVGLGTNNPVVELHIVDGDGPTVRLDQNGSAGFGTQVWDMVGNETNFFIRDTTNGSALTFRIQPGTDADTLVLDNEGQVSIGKTGGIEANATLHVRARNVANDPVLLIEATNQDDLLTLETDGDMILAGTLAQLSRRDSKEHFSKINHQAMLAALKGLDISTWNYKHQADSERHLGPVAEEFYATYGLGTDAEHIATSDMAAVALASSQALLFELEAKDERISELEDRLQRLESLMVEVLQSKNEDTPQLVNR